MSVAYDDGIEKVLTAKKCRSPAIVRFLHFTNLYGGAHIISTAADILEMVIKAAQMRIPFLVSRSGLTKMGHEIANKIGITMIGRAAGGKHYLLFTGKHRFRKTVAPTMVA